MTLVQPLRNNRASRTLKTLQLVKPSHFDGNPIQVDRSGVRVRSRKSLSLLLAEGLRSARISSDSNYNGDYKGQHYRWLYFKKRHIILKGVR